MKLQYVDDRLLKIAGSGRGVLILLTCARQTGKSILIKKIFPSYRNFTLDDPEVRLAVTFLTLSQLVENYSISIRDLFSLMRNNSGRFFTTSIS